MYFSHKKCERSQPKFLLTRTMCVSLLLLEIFFFFFTHGKVNSPVGRQWMVFLLVTTFFSPTHSKPLGSQTGNLSGTFHPCSIYRMLKGRGKILKRLSAWEQQEIVEGTRWHEASIFPICAQSCLPFPFFFFFFS